MILTHRLLLTLLCTALATLLCGIPRGLGNDPATPATATHAADRTERTPE